MTIKPNDVVYIAGPMTGKQHQNRPAFNQVHHYLQNTFGCIVLNPATHPDGLEYEQYMKIDLAMVEVSQWIVMLLGWESSPGARREKDHAEKHGLKVIYEQDLAYE